MVESTLSEILIGGSWVPAAAGTYPVIDPATEEIAGRAPEASVEQAREAARAAREAFEHGPWPRMSSAERGERLREAAARFREAAPDLVDLTVAETGSLRPVAVSQQVGARGRAASPSGSPPASRSASSPASRPTTSR